jgi:anti-sigma regulatory factor (Ser/Thr protein kinase)
MPGAFQTDESSNRGFEMELTRQPHTLAGLRTQVRTEIGDRDPRFDPETLGDIELICTELATNALDHAEAPRTIRVTWQERDCTVLIEATDASPNLAPTLGVSRLGGSRGRGLTMVDGISRWGVSYSSKAKTVWSVLTVRG